MGDDRDLADEQLASWGMPHDDAPRLAGTSLRQLYYESIAEDVQ
jgi:hypothetical protein